MRVWESYRTSRSLGYGYGSVTQLTEVLAIVAWAYRTHRIYGQVQKTLYPYPGYCSTGRTEFTEVPRKGMNVIQNSEKLRVLWHGRTELTKVPGRYKNAVPVPRVWWHERTELTEVPGTGINVAQNLQKFRVRV